MMQSIERLAEGDTGLRMVCVYFHDVNVFVNIRAIDVFIEPTVRDNGPVVTTHTALHHSNSAAKYRYSVHCRR